jgi:hypothetical protein
LTQPFTIRILIGFGVEWSPTKVKSGPLGLPCPRCYAKRPIATISLHKILVALVPNGALAGLNSLANRDIILMLREVRGG